MIQQMVSTFSTLLESRFLHILLIQQMVSSIQPHVCSNYLAHGFKNLANSFQYLANCFFSLTHLCTASHQIWTFLVSAGRPRSVQGSKIQSRSPPAQSFGGVQKSCALTSLEVDWDWWGRLQVGRTGGQGGGTPSPLASSSAGKDSREATKACMPAWEKMADQRLMRDVVVVCCDGAGTARALCCASKRRKSADS